MLRSAQHDRGEWVRRGPVGATAYLYLIGERQVGMDRDRKELHDYDFKARARDRDLWLMGDSRSTEELIEVALRELREGIESKGANQVVPLAMDIAGYEGENKPSDALAALQSRGTREVFKAAVRLTESPTPTKRELGATILGQNLVEDKSFPEEKFDVLFGLLENDKHPDVLSAVCYALGHLGEPRAIEPVARLKNHPAADVRLGVVHGLLSHEDPAAVAALIELSADEDDDVRDWATFGLGSSLEADTPEIREALAARLDDSYDDVRLEAIAGLGTRGDTRALEPLRHELEAGWDDISALEAAITLADPSLLPALLALRDEDRERDILEEAIAACGGAPGDDTQV